MKKSLILIFLIVGLSLSSLKAEAIKIGLIVNEKKLLVASSIEGLIINTHTNKLIHKLSPMKPYELKAYRNSILIKINGNYYNLGSNSIVLKASGAGFLATKKHWYRGEFIVENKKNKLTLINKIRLEDYLLGVVPSEMPSKWNIEALKAQAIAARSYAIANMGKQSKLGFDLKDNTEDQAYNGASSETGAATKAVMDTLGIVVTYNKQIIPAYYHSSSGGQTINSGKLWSKNLPYLRSVHAFDGERKKTGHGVGMSQHGANNLANQGYNAYQILTYFYNNIKFGKINPSWNL